MNIRRSSLGVALVLVPILVMFFGYCYHEPRINTEAARYWLTDFYQHDVFYSDTDYGKWCFVSASYFLGQTDGVDVNQTIEFLSSRETSWLAITALDYLDALDAINQSRAISYFLEQLENRSSMSSRELWESVDVLIRLGWYDDAVADSLSGYIASFQLGDGGFEWNGGGISYMHSTSRALLALSALNGLNKTDSFAAVQWIAERQLSDGGFEARANHGFSTVWDTCLAVRALKTTEKLETVNTRKIQEYIVSRQLIDGGFEAFQTWKLGPRHSDLPESRDALETLFLIENDTISDFSGSMLWGLNRFIYTWMCTSSGVFYIIAYQLIVGTFLLRGRILSLLKKMYKIKKIHEISASSVLRFLRKRWNYLCAFLLFSFGAVFRTVDWVFEFLALVIFLHAFNLAEFHRGRNISRILSIVGGLTLYYTTRTLMISFTSEVQGFAEKASALVNHMMPVILLILAFSLIAAIGIFYSTRWCKRENANLPVVKMWRKMKGESRTTITMFWGALKMTDSTSKKWDVCFSTSGIFFLVIFIVGVLSTLDVSYLNVKFWVFFLFVVWGLYDIAFFGGTGEVEEESYKKFVKIGRIPKSYFYLLLFLGTLFIIVGLLALLWSFAWQLSGFHNIFSSIDYAIDFGSLGPVVSQLYWHKAIGYGLHMAVYLVAIVYLGICPFYIVLKLLDEYLVESRGPKDVQPKVFLPSFSSILAGISCSVVVYFLLHFQVSFINELASAAFWNMPDELQLAFYTSYFQQVKYPMVMLLIVAIMHLLLTCHSLISKRLRILTSRLEDFLLIYPFCNVCIFVLILWLSSGYSLAVYVSGALILLLSLVGFHYDYLSEVFGKHRKSSKILMIVLYSTVSVVLIFIGGMILVFVPLLVMALLVNLVDLLKGAKAKNRLSFYLGIFPSE